MVSEVPGSVTDALVEELEEGSVSEGSFLPHPANSSTTISSARHSAVIRIFLIVSFAPFLWFCGLSGSAVS